MAHNDAILPENHIKISDAAIRYGKEFKSRNLDCLDINDEVLVKNETMKTKMDKEFPVRETIIGKLGNNTYTIGLKDGKEIIRHRT